MAGFDASAENKSIKNKLAFRAYKMDADTLQRASQAEAGGLLRQKPIADQAKRIPEPQDTRLVACYGAPHGCQQQCSVHAWRLGCSPRSSRQHGTTYKGMGTKERLVVWCATERSASDRDIAFLKNLQYNVNSLARRAAMRSHGSKWAAKRQAAYAAALRKWTEVRVALPR